MNSPSALVPGAVRMVAALSAAVQVAATDEGYAVLFTGAAPDWRPVVMTIGPEGGIISEPLELGGARFGYGVASIGDSIAVIAGRDTGEPMMRAFDLGLTPLGSWVCLGEDHDAISTPAVAADGDGYAAIHTATDGAVVLHRTDALGTGAQ